MIISDIKAILEREINDTVTNPDIAAWVYSALVEISKKYGRIVEWPRVAVVDTLYDLPADYLATSAVLDSDGEPYYDYEITEFGQISFEKADTFNVQYFAMPAALSVVEATMLATIPEVHLIFHEAIVDWCKHKYWELEADGDPEETRIADRFKMSFYQQVADSVRVLRARARKKRTIRRVD